MTTDAEQQAMWRRGAEGWGRRQAELREKTAPVADWLVAAIDPQPGQRVIELAAGPGETGFLIAAQLGSEGRLLSTDQAPQMVEVARQRATELGLTNVDFQVADAQDLDLPDDTFDAAVCRWGYMLMADPDAALRHTRRVLRPGGALALATWDRPDRNLWLAAPVIALVSNGLMAPPDPSAASPFAWFDPQLVASKLDATGFSEIRTDRVEFAQSYASFDDYWAETMDLAAPIAALVEECSPAEVDTVRTSARGLLAQFIDAGGTLNAPASAVVASARA